MKRLGALDARSLAWLTFAHEILGLPRQAVRWEADVLAAAALGLAACRPYMVRLEDVSVQVLALLFPSRWWCIGKGTCVRNLCSLEHLAFNRRAQIWGGKAMSWHETPKHLKEQ